MSTFPLPNSSATVTLVDDLSKKELLEFPAFQVRSLLLAHIQILINSKNWIRSLQTNLALQKSQPDHEFHASPYELRSIVIQAMDRFGPRVGFLKLVAHITNSDGQSLAGAVFLRGGSVGMLVVLQPDDLPVGSQEERHVLLTVQPRVAAGSLHFLELPAGMVDNGTFSGSAAKEIKEELGIDIPEDELVNLTELAIPESQGGVGENNPRAMFPSAGGCDEYIQLFLHEKRIPRAQLGEWTGKLTGLRDEGEMISLKLVRLEDLWWEGARDAKALSALALWEGLKRTGKL